MDLLSIVVKPTWKEFLIDLVASEQLDPWDLDLIQIADKYLDKVRQFQAMDLRIPANIILASAMLLRFKADALILEEEVAQPDEVLPLQDEPLPELVFKVNRPRNRRVTLEELLRSMEDVMKKGRRKPTRMFAPQTLLLDLPKEDLSQRMSFVYEKAVTLKDADCVLVFSALLPEKNADGIVRLLIPVLHLVQEEKLAMWQDDFFGEIFLKVLAEGQSAPAVEKAVELVE